MIIRKKNSIYTKALIAVLLLVKVVVILMLVNYFTNLPKPSDMVHETISGRTSVRQYTEASVPEELIEKLLRAAMAAPSSRNIQPWKFYVITDRQLLQVLAEKLPYAKMLAGAPLAIVVCGDTIKGNPNEEQKMNWIMDCSAASQNLLLSAHSMGLGAVWTGVYPYRERIDVVREALSLPGHLIPLNIIPVGYPDGDFPPKDKWDEQKIHFIREAD